ARTARGRRAPREPNASHSSIQEGRPLDPDQAPLLTDQSVCATSYERLNRVDGRCTRTLDQSAVLSSPRACRRGARCRRTGRPAAIEPRVPLVVPLSETMSVPAETRYAGSGEVSIAYQVRGAGSRDLVYVPGVSQHVELNWENPPVSRFLERLGSRGRVGVFVKRGTGGAD